MSTAGPGTYTVVYGSGCVVREGPSKTTRFAGRIPAVTRVDVLETTVLRDGTHRGRIEKPIRGWLSLGDMHEVHGKAAWQDRAAGFDRAVGGLGGAHYQRICQAMLDAAGAGCPMCRSHGEQRPSFALKFSTCAWCRPQPPTADPLEPASGAADAGGRSSAGPSSHEPPAEEPQAEEPAQVGPGVMPSPACVWDVEGPGNRPGAEAGGPDTERQRGE